MSGPRCIDLAALETAPASRAHAVDEASASAAPAGEAVLVSAVASARLVCFPTDTVYGIGGVCRARTYQAIWAAKGREPQKPLQVIFSTLELLLDVVRPGPVLVAALGRLLPGPVTLVLPYPDGFDGPPAGRAADGTPTLGVRVPPWPRPARVMAMLPFPLVASSANLSGAPPSRRPDEVPPTVRAACDLLLDGGETGGVASTVVDLVDYAFAGRWRVLREGALRRAELTAVLGPPAAS